MVAIGTMVQVWAATLNGSSDVAAKVFRPSSGQDSALNLLRTEVEREAYLLLQLQPSPFIVPLYGEGQRGA